MLSHTSSKLMLDTRCEWYHREQKRWFQKESTRTFWREGPLQCGMCIYFHLIASSLCPPPFNNQTFSLYFRWQRARDHARPLLSKVTAVFFSSSQHSCSNPPCNSCQLGSGFSVNTHAIDNYSVGRCLTLWQNAATQTHTHTFLHGGEGRRHHRDNNDVYKERQNGVFSHGMRTEIIFA